MSIPKPQVVGLIHAEAPNLPIPGGFDLPGAAADAPM